MIPINDELLFLTKATGLATCAMYKRLRNDRQKLNEAFYQLHHFWTRVKTIRELHKITIYTKKGCQVMVSKVSTLASLYTITKENKSPSLQGEKTF